MQETFKTFRPNIFPISGLRRFHKEIKNASELLSYISTREFLSTRKKCIEKNEAQHFSGVLKK